MAKAQNILCRRRLETGKALVTFTNNINATLALRYLLKKWKSANVIMLTKHGKSGTCQLNNHPLACCLQRAKLYRELLQKESNDTKKNFVFYVKCSLNSDFGIHRKLDTTFRGVRHYRIKQEIYQRSTFPRLVEGIGQSITRRPNLGYRKIQCSMVHRGTEIKGKNRIRNFYLLITESNSTKRETANSAAISHIQSDIPKSNYEMDLTIMAFMLPIQLSPNKLVNQYW